MLWLRCKKLEMPVNIVQEKVCHITAKSLFDRSSGSAVWGYSSLSIMFLSNVSAINSRASGSIQVVTNVARFKRAFPFCRFCER
jgi:hypothetical protein